MTWIQIIIFNESSSQCLTQDVTFRYIRIPAISWPSPSMDVFLLARSRVRYSLVPYPLPVLVRFAGCMFIRRLIHLFLILSILLFPVFKSRGLLEVEVDALPKVTVKVRKSVPTCYHDCLSLPFSAGNSAVCVPSAFLLFRKTVLLFAH